MFHWCEWKRLGNIQDYIAWKALSGRDQEAEEGIRLMTAERMRNRVVSDETRQKMRQAKLGRTFKHKEETKKKIGLSNGKRVYCIELNQEWNNCSEAARDLGISHKSISACCTGQRKFVYLNRDKPGRGRPRYRFKYI